MEADLGDLEALVAAGAEPQLRRWLGERVWPLGRRLNGEQLVQQVSGQPPSAPPRSWAICAASWHACRRTPPPLPRMRRAV